MASTTVLPDEAALSSAGLTGTSVMAGPVQELLAPLVAQAASGSLKVQIQEVLPLEQAAAGLGTLAAGQAQGRIVVTVDA